MLYRAYMPSDKAHIFSSNLRAAMKAKGVTAFDLAHDLYEQGHRTRESSVYRWTSKTNPKPPRDVYLIKDIADILDTDSDSLTDAPSEIKTAHNA